MLSRHSMAMVALSIAACAAIVTVVAYSSPADRTPRAVELLQRPLSVAVVDAVVEPPPRVETRVVRADVREPQANYDVTPEFLEQAEHYVATRQKQTARFSAKGRGYPATGLDATAVTIAEPAVAQAAGGAIGEVASFESTNFVDNIPNTGSIFIPADSQGAAGTNHVVSVTNTTLRAHTKTGTVVLDIGLVDFFSQLSPLTFTFDPRVVFDRFSNRWVVITDERTDTLTGQASNTARLFVAVSETDDPTGAWSILEIDAETIIFNPPAGGNVPHWVDFPILAVDEEAVYITGSMFSFFNTGGIRGGDRLWIIAKGEGTGGFYDGGNATIGLFDPFAGGGEESSAVPAMVFGAPGSPTLGTYLVTYSGLSNQQTSVEAVQVVRIDDPLGTPTFTPRFVPLGDIHNTNIGLPDPPQNGTPDNLVANDSRTQQAVLRDNAIWTAFSITPNFGDPEAGQALAYWVRVDVSNPSAPVVAEQGRVSGDDIAPTTHTFFPGISVNSNHDVMIGFAGSAASIFAGAYYALHDSGAPAGSVGPSMTLRAGVAPYLRTFGGPFNRWGDYSSVDVDPVDDCFWIFGKYAITQGTVTDAGNGPEDGRWGTRFAKFCNAECAGVPDPVTELTVEDPTSTTLNWLDQGAGFSYDVVIGLISEMRSDGAVIDAGCLASAVTTPMVDDSLPDPPPGAGRYYLVRPRSACELGDYGSASSGAPRMPTPGCPE